MKLRAIAIVLVILIMILFFSTLNKPTSLKGFVTNMTLERSEDLLFKYEILKYPCNVEIIPKPKPEEELQIGVTVEPWNLNFGIIPAGDNFGRRYVTLTNTKDKKVKVNLRAYGNIIPMVSFDKDNILIGKDESITVTVFMTATNTTFPGNYTGEIDVVSKIPKYDFVYSMIEWF